MPKVVINGGSRGIGYACSRRMTVSGWQVQSVARSPLAVEPLQNPLWRHVLTDLSAEIPVDAWREFFGSDHSRCAVVQALGGTLGIRSDASVQDWRAVMELNFFLPLQIQQALLPILRECHEPTIVYIGSSSVWHGHASAPYVSAKAALHQMIAASGRELAKEGILVCGVAPAAVSGYGNSWDRCRTEKPDVWKQTAAQQALGRFQTPDEIALRIADILEKRPMELAGTIVNLDASVTP